MYQKFTMSPNNTICNEMDHSSTKKNKLNNFSLNRDSSSFQEEKIVKRVNKLRNHENLLSKRRRMAQLLLINSCKIKF